MHFNYIALPTTSNPNKLTLIKDGYPSINKITMQHYIDDEIVDIYELNLKVGLRNMQPQEYLLLNLTEGKIEISIELDDGMTYGSNKITIVKWNDASKNLYDNGLLIFLTTDFNSKIYIDDCVYYNQYIYIISKKDSICYIKQAGKSEWIPTESAPSLRRLAKKHNTSYITVDYNWKEENQWIKREN